MKKAYHAAEGIFSLFATLIVFAIWSQFGTNPITLKSAIYFVLLVVPLFMHMIFSFLAIHNLSRSTVAGYSRVATGAGWIVAAALSRFY